MEITKEQQSIIDRYAKMPSFLQSRNAKKTIHDLIKIRMKSEDVEYYVFKNSNKNVKIKNIDIFSLHFMEMSNIKAKEEIMINFHQNF